MKFYQLLFGSFLLILFSCKKESNNNGNYNCPPPQTYLIDSFTNQFNFSKGTWMFKDTGSNKIDSMSVDYSKTFVEYGGVSHCGGDEHHIYNVKISHNLFPVGTNSFELIGETNDLSIPQANTNYAYVGVFQKSVGTIVTSNPSHTSELENFYPTLTINGIIFHNVYQMWYSPDLAGFKRIWWCPKVGFVKVEFTNTVSHISETWELLSYSVKLN